MSLFCDLTPLFVFSINMPPLLPVSLKAYRISLFSITLESKCSREKFFLVFLLFFLGGAAHIICLRFPHESPCEPSEIEFLIDLQLGLCGFFLFFPLPSAARSR